MIKIARTVAGKYVPPTTAEQVVQLDGRLLGLRKNADGTYTVYEDGLAAAKSEAASPTTILIDGRKFQVQNDDRNAGKMKLVEEARKGTAGIKADYIVDRGVFYTVSHHKATDVFTFSDGKYTFTSIAGTRLINLNGVTYQITFDTYSGKVVLVQPHTESKTELLDQIVTINGQHFTVSYDWRTDAFTLKGATDMFVSDPVQDTVTIGAVTYNISKSNIRAQTST